MGNTRRARRKNPHAGHQGTDRSFIKSVAGLASQTGRDYRRVLDDFLELSYWALPRPQAFRLPIGDEDREARYMSTVDRLPADYVRAMPQLLAILHQGVQEKGDFIGVVAGELGALSGHTGQYFTPPALCRVMVELTIKDVERPIREKGFIAVDEPACGAAGMLLVVADMLEEHGFSPERYLLAKATDVSWMAVRMAYLQLSFRGVPAVVVHGDTLRGETWSIDATAAFDALLAKNPRAAAHVGETLLREG